MTNEQKRILETSLEYLHEYANNLRDLGDAGNTEADDNADFVFAHIAQMCDAFQITINDDGEALFLDDDDDDNEVCIKWSIEDVKEVAPNLSDAVCRRVLEIAKDKHDANEGINWDVLTFWAGVVRNERKQ